MSEATAIMLLEHTGYDDFNLEEHQIKGRLEAIEVLIKQNKQLKEVIEEVRELLKGCIEKYGVNNMNTKDFDELLQILDKAKEDIWN